eukprot:14288380-Alexandrium_andersonii.AAC.1
MSEPHVLFAPVPYQLVVAQERLGNPQSGRASRGSDASWTMGLRAPIEESGGGLKPSGEAPPISEHTLERVVLNVAELKA